ncbi:homoserine kinase [Helicobacter enhydrae]|uniref:Homoserine kinase n=1 Tax=Helicobacter enhydrae TaxID=222136 RepID=A0A1B1U608_9HELI|nr:homoserine kinase [Helicobacter enhydrae]ANV98125.1 homoserine kinase [Helicobacter enhydrae]
MIITVPATSANLGPGFDCLGLSLKFRNRFEIVPATRTLVEIHGEGSTRLRSDENNLFVRIFRETLRSLGCDEMDYYFKFDNKIPISRGLGSSSATIVGAISGAYLMAGKRLDRGAVLNRALIYENHPDNIAPATFGGFVISMLDRQRVFYIKENISRDIKAVVVIPDKPMNTKYARSILPKKYTMEECVFNISHASFLSGVFLSEKWEFLRLASKDMLHQRKRIATYPVLQEVQRYALEFGALTSTLSGSGSSILNICYADDQGKIFKKLSDKFPNFRVLALEFDNLGVLKQG